MSDEHNQLQYMCKIWSTTQIHFEHKTHNGPHKDKTVISISFTLKNINQSISIKINQSWQSNYQLVMLNKKHQVNSTYKSKTQSHYLQKLRKISQSIFLKFLLNSNLYRSFFDDFYIIHRNNWFYFLLRR